METKYLSMKDISALFGKTSNLNKRLFLTFQRKINLGKESKIIQKSILANTVHTT